MRTPPLPHGVLLDLDGTLVDTVGTRIEAWLRVFTEFQVPAERGFVAELIGSDGKRLATEVGGRAGVAMDDDLAERIDHRAGEIYSSLNTDPVPLPGVGALLDALDALAIPWAIATSSRRAQVGRSIAALQRPSEPRIVDGSSVQRAKPAPDLLLAGADAVGVAASDCWCVGDSTWDMLAAVAADMTPIAVLAGSAVQADALASAGAILVVARADELLPFLSNPR